MNITNPLAKGAYNGSAAIASAAYHGTVKGAKAYTAMTEAAHLVASSAFEVGNDIRKGVTGVASNPVQSFKNATYFASGMSNFAEARETIRRAPDQSMSIAGKGDVIHQDDRTLLTRMGDAASQAGIGAAKLGVEAGSVALYAASSGFRGAVNTTAGALGSVAMKGAEFAVSATIKALEAAGSASLVGANRAVTDPNGAIQDVAHYTAIFAGAAGALGMGYLSAKALISAEAERAGGSDWGSRFKAGAYLLGSATTAVTAATLAAASYQTYTK